MSASALLPFELTESSFASALHEMVDAINAQDFNFTSPAWRHASADLVCDFSFSDWPRKTTSLQQMLENFALHFQRHPEYRIEIADMSFHINNNTGQADSFINVEVKGLPPGVIRPSLGTVNFVRSSGKEKETEKGKWAWVKYTNFPGMAAVGGEGNGFGGI